MVFSLKLRAVQINLVFILLECILFKRCVSFQILMTMRPIPRSQSSLNGKLVESLSLEEAVLNEYGIELKTTYQGDDF